MSHNKRDNTRRNYRSEDDGDPPSAGTSSLVQLKAPPRTLKPRTGIKAENDGTGTGSNIGTQSHQSISTRSRTSTPQSTIDGTPHPLMADTGDPYPITGNGSKAGGGAGNTGGGTSNEHNRSTSSKNIAGTPMNNKNGGGERKDGIYEDTGGTDYDSGGDTSAGTRNSTSRSIPSRNKYTGSSKQGARRSTKSGSGDNTGGDDSDGSSGSSGRDGGGGTPPVKHRSSRSTTKRYAGGDDDEEDMYKRTKQYSTVTVIGTLPAVPSHIIIRNTDIGTVKKFKKDVEVYLKQAGAWEFAVKPSEWSWKLIKNKYADAKNAWTIYYEFRGAHSRLAATLYQMVSIVYPDLVTEITALAEKYQRDNKDHDDEINDMNPRYTVNAYTGTFIADNANLVWKIIMKRLENVKTSTFHITSTVNAVHSLKYDPSGDPACFYDKYTNAMNELDEVLKGNAPLPGRMYPENVRASIFINALPAHGDIGTVRSAVLNSSEVLTVEQIVEMMKVHWQSKQAKVAGGVNTGGGGSGGTYRTGGNGTGGGGNANVSRALITLCDAHDQRRDTDLIETFTTLGLTADGIVATGNRNNGGGGTNKHKHGKKKGKGKGKGGNDGAMVTMFIMTEDIYGGSDGGGGDADGTGSDSDTSVSSTGTVFTMVLPLNTVNSLDPQLIRKVLAERGHLTRQICWIMDTGSTASTTHNETLLVPGSIEEVSPLRIIGINCTKPLTSTRAGKAKLNQWVTLTKVHVVPGSGVNIISASDFKKAGCEFQTKGNFLDVYTKEDKIVITFIYVSGLWIYAHPKRFININDDYDPDDVNVELTKPKSSNGGTTSSTSSTSTSSTSTSSSTSNANAGGGTRNTIPKKKATGTTNTSKASSSTGGANAATAKTTAATTTSGPSAPTKATAASAVSHYAIADCDTTGIANAVITIDGGTTIDTSSSKGCTIELVSVGNDVSDGCKIAKDDKCNVDSGAIITNGTSIGGGTSTGTCTGTTSTSEQTMGSSTSLRSPRDEKVNGINKIDGTAGGGTHIITVTSNGSTIAPVSVENGVSTGSKTAKVNVGQLKCNAVSKSNGSTGGGTNGTLTGTGGTTKSTGKVKYTHKMVITSGGPTGTIPMNGTSVGWKAPSVSSSGTTNVGITSTNTTIGTNSNSSVSIKTSTGNGNSSNTAAGNGTKANKVAGSKWVKAGTSAKAGGDTKVTTGNGISSNVSTAGTTYKGGTNTSNGNGTSTTRSTGITSTVTTKNGGVAAGGATTGGGTTGTATTGNATVLKATTVKQSVAGTVHELHCKWSHRTITKAMLEQIGFTGDTTMVTGNGYTCGDCAPTKMKANYTGGGTYEQPAVAFERMNYDVIGPISYVNTFTRQRERVHTYTGEVYILVGIEQKHGVVMVHKMKSKDQAAQHMIDDTKFIKTQYGVNVKHIHTDGGTEFVNKHFQKHCRGTGIKHTYTTAGTPQHNGKVERMNGTLVGMVKSMLYTSGASVKLWGEAISYAALVHNVTPTRTGGPSPMKAATGIDFDVTKLQPFGCDCFVLPAPDTVGKLQQIGQPGIFIGIAVNQINATMVMTGTQEVKVSLNVSVDCDSFEHVELLSLNGKSLTSTDVICDEGNDGSTIHSDNVNGTGNHADWYGAGSTTTNNAGSTGTHSTGTGNANAGGGKTTIDSVTGKQRISYAGDDSSGDEFSDYVPSDDDDASTGNGMSDSEMESKYDDDTSTGTDADTGIASTGTQMNDDVIGGDLFTVNEHDDSFNDGYNGGGDPYAGTADAGTTTTGTTTTGTATNVQPSEPQLSSLQRLPRPSHYSHLVVPVLPFESTLFATGTEWGWNDFTGGTAVSYHSQHSYAVNGGLLANYQRSVDMIINSNITEDDYIATVNSAVNEPYEPNTYNQAMKSREAVKWRAAILEEYNSLHENKVLVPVKRTAGMNILGTRLVFKVKTDENNCPTRWKCRLVAKGYNQREGIDYHETYSPVARFNSMRTLISLAAINDLEMKQIDFKTAFLNAGIAEEIYVAVPPGYNDVTGNTINEKTHCFKLNRALYGLKQSPLEWYKLLHEILTDAGYKNTDADPCYYYKYVDGCSIPIMITVYVDDCIIAYPKQLEYVWLADKAKICEKYKIDDLDDINFCLKMKIERDRNAGTISISQYGYVMALLNEYKLNDLKPADNPCLSADLTAVNESQPDMEVPLLVNGFDHEMYRSMVGSLMYLGNTTRPDICYAVSFLARYLAAPLKKHMKAVKHIFRYLIKHPNYVLVYGRTGTTGGLVNGVNDTAAVNFPNGVQYGGTIGTTGNPAASVTNGTIDPSTGAPYKVYAGTTTGGAGTLYLNGYTDSDWASDSNTRCSTSGGIVTLNGNIISWLCQKQHSIAQSSTESEYYAVNSLSNEIVWFQNLLYQLFNKHLTSVLFIDNQAAMHWATGEALKHKRSKHVDTRYKYVRQLLQKGRIKVQWKPSAYQLADILTKNTTKNVFVNLRDQLLGLGSGGTSNGGDTSNGNGTTGGSTIEVEEV